MKIYPSGIDSFSFMLSSAEVPTLLFETRFAAFRGPISLTLARWHIYNPPRPAAPRGPNRGGNFCAMYGSCEPPPVSLPPHFILPCNAAGPSLPLWPRLP